MLYAVAVIPGSAAPVTLYQQARVARKINTAASNIAAQRRPSGLILDGLASEKEPKVIAARSYETRADAKSLKSGAVLPRWGLSVVIKMGAAALAIIAVQLARFGVVLSAVAQPRAVPAFYALTSKMTQPIVEIASWYALEVRYVAMVSASVPMVGRFAEVSAVLWVKVALKAVVRAPVASCRYKEAVLLRNESSSWERRAVHLISLTTHTT